MSGRDSLRSRVYEAEHLAHRMFDRTSSSRLVQLAGASITLPPEARFASVGSVRDYVGRVLEMDVVTEQFTAAGIPVAVVERGGHRSAEYRRRPDGSREIAIPTSREGRWALRELVVLHELAHHFDDSGGPAHGVGFVHTLIALVGSVLGPEAAFVYRVVFADSGVL
ncbi:TIGR04338 family metallohydrolase [Gordonia pseudamarae]|jgi:putative metallohydrolase (TIGR04338 family)|uniref:TIGR04338 family metallohydrolase n=1 Tax=Gordonia pseudamarae TaxID=2831662 RepID=A0ABX6IKT8_9ACTN|nr:MULTISPECIES: TIGR04338 family metallohydrolase [Gordonia]MBD0020602.1 TIGR04338 family metallohydrolase [Gordonia sp. (in: high G+C Gram-positive bacteria)]QHN27651.1 TIGR04338 family metallohydrolase [Gordonia pseudamarae]QHN36533.1 TIGR04338 family metallohydrolase [Gordonia pseudamarae]